MGKKAKDKVVEVIKVLTDALLGAYDAIREGEGKNTKIVFENGAIVDETPFRLYFTNPADSIERPEKFGDSPAEVRKDNSIGIKFLKATSEADVIALLDFASTAEVYVEPKPAEDKSADDGDDSSDTLAKLADSDGDDKPAEEGEKVAEG